MTGKKKDSSGVQPAGKKTNWFLDIMGFHKSSLYIKRYQQDDNVRSSIYMSSIVVGLETFMLLRYIYGYVMFPGKYDSSPSAFFENTKNYWLFLIAGFAMLVYGILYLSGKIKKSDIVSSTVITGFAAVCLYFGVLISFEDFQSGNMFVCFLTMVLFVACLLIWRPYISILLLTIIATGFVWFVNNNAFSDVTGERIKINSADLMNYIMFFITVTMITISIYHQRRRVAVEAEKIYVRSITDDLTGIPNMDSFAEGATEYCKKHKDYIYLFFNIENFKTYNDQLGFNKGNKFLVDLGQLISQNFEGYPYARQGDDHFVALVGKDYMDRITKVREGLSHIKDYEGYIELKVGGFAPSEKSMTPHACIDKARYAAGMIKNRADKFFCEYDEKLDKSFRQRSYVLNNIDRAIRKGFIKVYYQPVMDSKDNRLCGCEALVRWIDPEQGLMPPGAFVSILEESRQIHKLDKCVWELVCRDMSDSLEKGLPVVPVSLNFSRLDFELMDPLGELEALVSQYNIPRDNLHVEITESALTSDDFNLEQYIDMFHEKGYEIWLDDFGSGYSSLNVLKDFKFDLIKLDMLFLRNFGEREESRIILRNIVKMADELGMATLCEGVETNDAVDYLKSIGCGRLQGYFFGKPIPYSEFKGLLQRKD